MAAPGGGHEEKSLVSCVIEDDTNRLPRRTLSTVGKVDVHSACWEWKESVDEAQNGFFKGKSVSPARTF